MALSLIVESTIASWPSLFTPAPSRLVIPPEIVRWKTCAWTPLATVRTEPNPEPSIVSPSDPPSMVSSPLVFVTSSSPSATSSVLTVANVVGSNSIESPAALVSALAPVTQ